MTSSPASTLRLISEANSPHSHLALFVLALKHIPYELIPSSYTSKPPELLQANPFAAVPVLLTPTFSLYESRAIVRYLDAAYPSCDGAGGNHLSLAFAFCFCFGCYCFESSRASPSRVAATLCSLSVVHLTTPRCSACGSCLQFCSRLLFCTLLFCRSFAYTATCRRLSASIYSSRLTSRLLLSVLAVPRCLSYESRAAVSEELAVSAAPHNWFRLLVLSTAVCDSFAS